MIAPHAVPLCRPSIADSAEGAIRECLASGWLGYGPRCGSLETLFTAHSDGVAVATSSCTSALYLAAQLCWRSSVDEAIVPAITFVSTAMAFQGAGYRVVVADVDPKTAMLSVADVERAITPHTRVVVAVHLFGQHYDTSSLRDLCDAHDVVLIEDCAHRVDLLDDGQPLGDMACYSFNAVKEAPGGEGGMFWCRSVTNRDRVRALSNLGLTVDTMQRSRSLAHADYQFTGEVALKLRGNDLSACLTLSSLRELSTTRARRATIFGYYDQAIRRGTSVVRPLERGPDDSYLMYVVRVPAEVRDQVRSSMAASGVATSVHYPSLTRHPLFQNDWCPVAEAIEGEIITLPCFPELTDSERARVVDALLKAASDIE